MEDLDVLIKKFINREIREFKFPMSPNDLSDRINKAVGEDIQMEVGDVNGWECFAVYNYIGERIMYAISINGYYENKSTVYKINEEGYEI